MDNCDECNGRGWISYYEVVNKGKMNEGYYTNHRKCNKCDMTGKRNKQNLEKLGNPDNTSLMLARDTR